MLTQWGRFSGMFKLLRLLSGLFCLLFPWHQAQALVALDDDGMAGVTGAGVNFVWEDFRWLTKPTSYFEQVGTGVDPATVWKRGDLRWYGLSVSGTGAGWDWTESGGAMKSCAGLGANGLGCPIGGVISRFAAHDNPYVVRVMDYAGDGLSVTDIGNGQQTNGVVDFDGNVNASHTVWEQLAPTLQDNYRFSFWGEIEVGKNPVTLANQGLLKTQTMIQGSAANSVIQLFQFTEPGNRTLAILYHSHLQGDFRFSAAQQAGYDSDEIGVPVAFEPVEGLHFRNVEAYVPLGQLFYQALLISVPENNQSGNFILEVPTIPNVDAVYTRFYSLARANADANIGYDTARAGYLHRLHQHGLSNGLNYTASNGAYTPSWGPRSGQIIQMQNNYYTTHGYSYWGDWTPCQGVGCAAPPATMPTARNSYNSRDDGIFFSARNGGSFNAFAYRLSAIDVRSNNYTYTCPGGSNCGAFNQPVQAGRYYIASANCTRDGSLYNCGYGGSFAKSAPITTVSAVNPAYYFGHAAGGNQNLPMINTGTANLGDARAEGLLINAFKFTSLGAQF
jgi:hypothetical protein